MFKSPRAGAAAGACLMLRCWARHALRTLGLLVLLSLQPVQAQSGSCSNYPNSECQVSNALFVVQTGVNSGKSYATGDAACAAAAGPPTYQNPKFWVNYPSRGTGCEYDVYSGSGGNLVYEGRHLYQNWVLGRQDCPVRAASEDDYYSSYYNEHSYNQWYDTSDQSVQAAGRRWCVYCRAGTSYIGGGVCATILDVNQDDPGSCKDPSVGNPIFPLTGVRRQTEAMLPARLSLVYDTRSKLPNGNGSQSFSVAAAPSFGRLWHSSLHKRLVLQAHQPDGTVPAVQASRGGATWLSFKRDNSTGAYLPDVDVADKLSPTTSGWTYWDAAARALEFYDPVGVLQSVAFASGAVHRYVYSDASTPASQAPRPGLLIAVQDQNGRTIGFEYETPASGGAPRIRRVIDADGADVLAGYDGNGNLSELRWPDGRVRLYVYENGALPWALTGIVDENSSRFANYTYDTSGRAASTEYAGGVNRYAVAYSSRPPQWQVQVVQNTSARTIWRTHTWIPPLGTTVERPNGSTSSLTAVTVAGASRLTSQSQPAGAGCAAASSAATYDANGNFASKTDFNGNKICYANDLARNLEVARVEGLAAAATCSSVTAAGASLPAGSRKVSTQWHPHWSLPVRQSEPGNVTVNVYNGQPDPAAGGATASCAPAAALLPDGKPIAVLCKKVEQATTNATGALGFNATSTGTPRTWTYTYNEHGQVLTARDPLNNLTTYSYYSDTSAEHTRGDLQSVTNPAGHTTQYTRYDRSGRPLESVDANGTKTETTYTPRGWVKTVTTTPPGGAAQTTVYDYDGVGQLKKATLSDSTALEYTYDAAHRLRSVKDAAGNAVTYTLDNMGNRIGEELKDASGTLARNITRVYDALNRVQGTTGLGP